MLGVRGQEVGHGEDPGEEVEAVAGETGGAVGGVTLGDGGEEEEVEEAAVEAATTIPSLRSSRPLRRPPISYPWYLCPRTTARVAPTSHGSSTCRLSRDVVQ